MKLTMTMRIKTSEGEISILNCGHVLQLSVQIGPLLGQPLLLQAAGLRLGKVSEPNQMPRK
jgi:hypothetical protein